MVRLNLGSRLYNLVHDFDPTPAAEFVKWLAESAGLPANLHILDIGCGTGRMFTPYTVFGWRVTGIEPNPDYAEGATKLAETFDEVRIRQGGFADINDDTYFHVVAAVNDPFAYLLTPAERDDALKRVYKALKPGGVLLLELPNFLFILHNYREPKMLRFNMGSGEIVRVTTTHDIDLHDCIWTHTEQFRIDDGVNDSVYVEQVHKLAIFSLPELLYNLERAGFESIETYGSYQSRICEKLDGPRMIITARKPTAEAIPDVEEAEAEMTDTAEVDIVDLDALDESKPADVPPVFDDDDSDDSDAAKPAPV